LTIFDSDERCEFEVETNARFLRIEASNRAPELMLVDDVKRRSPKAFRNIVAGMTSHPNPSVRHSLVKALSTTREPETLASLVDVLSDREGHVREEALRCLREVLKGIDGLPDAEETSPEKMQASWRTWLDAHLKQLYWGDGAFREEAAQPDDAGAQGPIARREDVDDTQGR